MLNFMKNYFPKLLAFIVAVLIFLGVLPKNYDPFEEPTSSVTEITQTQPDDNPHTDIEQPKTSVTQPIDPNNPASWSTEQIVDFYKSAAEKTQAKGCKSHSEMKAVSLKNVPSLVKGSIENAINSNVEERDGITGGYSRLQANDLQIALARKDGNKVIITMIPKDQTDGPNGREGEGTVGHVVYVVNGVQQVLSKTGLTGNFPEGTVRIEYKHAYANNIVVDVSTGLIESGTWGYDAYVYLNGCTISGFKAKNIEAVIEYTVMLL